jgi:pimeloyl-ACP methyl ester carboxylesterase
LINPFKLLSQAVKAIRAPSYPLTISLLFLICSVAQADLIEIKIPPSNIIARAQFMAGEAKKPAILLLHGFLQTHNFFTVSRLASSLAGEGYNVLSPTLSLGIDKRKKSLPCEAIHTHNIQDDGTEIKFWLDWLKSKGYQNVLLIGHSYGSLQLLLYQAKEHNSIVKKIIATSLIDIDYVIGRNEYQSQINSAKTLLKQNKNSLGHYKIGQCNKYMTSPSAFLSYAMWDKKEIIGLLNKVQTPVYIIMGGKDMRMAKNWPETLKQAKAKVVTIKGANHFFDAEFEFDLFETVLGLIQQN